MPFNEPNFLEKCKIDGCTHTFCCYPTFNSHKSRKHRGVDIESEARKAARMEDIDQSGEDALGGNNSERGGNSESDAGTVDDSFGDIVLLQRSQSYVKIILSQVMETFFKSRLSLW